jgi:hypothetical protein
LLLNLNCDNLNLVISKTDFDLEHSRHNKFVGFDWVKVVFLLLLSSRSWNVYLILLPIKLNDIIFLHLHILLLLLLLHVHFFFLCLLVFLFIHHLMMLAFIHFMMTSDSLRRHPALIMPAWRHPLHLLLVIHFLF